MKISHLEKLAKAANDPAKTAADMSQKTMDLITMDNIAHMRAFQKAFDPATALKLIKAFRIQREALENGALALSKYGDGTQEAKIREALRLSDSALKGDV